MSTERQIRGQLAHLLGFIVLMEEKVQHRLMQIEILKQELAGHDEFDTRVAFLALDTRGRGYISMHDLMSVVSGMGSGLSLDNRSQTDLSNFFKRYGNGQRLTYSEQCPNLCRFLKQVRPKMNIQLSQSLLVRNVVKKHLPDHLRERFELLMAYYLLLSAQSERLRLLIQAELGVNFVEIYEMVRYDMVSESRIQAFFQQHGDAVSRHQARYLINHTKDLKEFEEWTEQEFKEIFSPVDSLRRFQQPLAENVGYHAFQQRSLNTQPELRPVKKDNYLGVRFNNTAQAALHIQRSRTDTFGNSELRATNSQNMDREAPSPPPNIQLRTIDKFVVAGRRAPESFVRQSRASETSSVVARNTQPVLLHQPQLERFMLPPGKLTKAVELFEDELEDSQRSVFRYY